MTRALPLALSGLLALALVAGAVAPPVPPSAPARAARPPVRTAPADDQLDFMFFASDRPVLIRLHLRIGDKPYSVAWDAWMDRLFAWFDKDNNGTLSPAEVARLIPSNFLQNQVQGSIGGPVGQAVPFANLDTNKDGKVTKEEFRAYYRNGGFGALRFFNQNFQARNARQTNDAIYRRLALDPKGQLKQEDAARLPGLMAKLDEDENELLTSTELNIEGNNDNNNYGFVVPTTRMKGPQQPNESGLIQIQPKMARDQLVRQLLTHYDKNKDGKLMPGEIEPKFFAQLDMDGDGKLDMEELKAFFRRPPDLVFLARVGPLGGNSVLEAVNRFTLRLPVRQVPRTEVLNPTQPLARKVRKINADNLSFDLGDARFALQANQGFQNGGGRFNGVKNFYLQQFDSIVDKKKGYLEKKQEKENQQNPFVFQIFNQADKNADGKLTRKELEAWLDLMSDGSNGFVTLQVNDMGRSLFDLIDTNSDSQLSLRELRTAWERIKPLCKEGKGLTQPDLPRSLRISMGLGNTFFASPVPFGGVMAPRSTRGATGSVPAWFTKMDINGDGDVSPKEWLGTEEEFKEIDVDGDGLISANEARGYEARKKKDSTKKPAQPK